MLEFSMIHGDIRRAALERWLGAQLPASFTLSPASEDASVRRSFRAEIVRWEPPEMALIPVRRVPKRRGR